MIRGLYASASGLTALMQKQEIETNNLVNANTSGYKRQQTIFKGFKNVLLDEINYQKGTTNRKNIGKLGKGVMVDDVINVLEQGIIVASDVPTNLAIDGEGYFTVKDENGKGFYTRDGSFKISSEGLLVNNNGLKVVGQNGDIPMKGDIITITEDGTVSIDGEKVDRLKLANLEDPNKVGANLFLPDDKNEALPFDIKKGLVRQGYTEESNANVIDEMTKMIGLMRAYETNQKVIQTFDNTLDKTINEVGRA